MCVWAMSSLSHPFLSPSQVSVSTGTKKLVAATALGAFSLLFLARHFQRRKGKRKLLSSEWEKVRLEFFSPASAGNGETSRSSKSPCEFVWRSQTDQVVSPRDSFQTTPAKTSASLWPQRLDAPLPCSSPQETTGGCRGLCWVCPRWDPFLY